VRIKDVGSVFCKDENIKQMVSDIIILNVPDVKEKTFVFSVLRVIELIQKKCPEVDVSNEGESDFIVDYKRKKPKKNFIDVVKVIAICIVVFMGSMFTIMAYNNDININELFEKLYELTGDNQSTGVIELCYSIGLTGGICIFYNHFAGKRLDNVPTPVEVQMRSYETDINSAIVDRASRLKEESDV
jgi:stage V sporulation protein AA